MLLRLKLPTTATIPLKPPPPHFSPTAKFRSLSPQNRPFTTSFSLPFPRSLPLPKSSPDPFFAHTTSTNSAPKPYQWRPSPAGDTNPPLSAATKPPPLVTAVVLGWLGGKQKHLRRYAEFYNGLGFGAVTFVTAVGDVLSLDVGRRVEDRVAELVRELVRWLEGEGEDGRERFLVFHTFSNAGWLAYGAILKNLQHRHDLLEKIKGSVFDSGPDPEPSPKVWAAGFAAALLGKRSSTTYSPSDVGTDKHKNEAISSKIEEKDPLIEVVVLAVLEKFFSYILKLPDVNKKLMDIISILTNNQPHCPQLYLYSSADKVLPFQSVESFIEVQRKMGRKVTSFDFGSSPHVDHYRSFPTLYETMLQNHLQECFALVK